METLKGLTRSRQIILGAGVLLLIFSFFAWQSVDLGILEVSRNAWHGFWGVVMGLLTIALLLWVGARAFGVALPANIPDGLATLALGAAILLCAVLKNLTDDYSAWASYVGMILAAGVAYGAWLAFQESGEALPELNRARPAGSTTPAAQPAPSPAESEPPSAPAGSDPA
jgi:hypothetical protein